MLIISVLDAKNVIVCDEGWIERLAEENKRRGSLPPQPHMSLDNLAYTVYSSGTTGKPKGIEAILFSPIDFKPSNYSPYKAVGRWGVASFRRRGRCEVKNVDVLSQIRAKFAVSSLNHSGIGPT